MRVGVKIGDWLQHISAPWHQGEREKRHKDCRRAGEVQLGKWSVSGETKLLIKKKEKKTSTSDIYSLDRLLRRYRSYKRGFAPRLQSSTSCSGI